MAIIVDVGNTRVRLARFDRAVDGLRPGCLSAGSQAPALARPGEMPTAGGPEAVAPWVARLVAAQAPQPVVLVSVVPALTVALADAVPDLVVLAASSPWPFRIDVDAPAAVGVDRLCNVAAAAAAGCRDALVVDVGTATTFDVLQGGVFRGGLIAPGPGLAAECLGARAAQLDAVPFGPAPLEPGRTTAAAMAAGAWHVGMGGIRSTAAGLAAACGLDTIIVTGGLGAHLADLGTFDPDWTFRGAAAVGLA